MTRKMVEPGREELMFNELLDAHKKRAVLKAVKDEKTRIAALDHIEPAPVQLRHVDDLWEYLLLHVCQVTPAQKEHFTSVLRDASAFAANSSFEKDGGVHQEQWYNELQTRRGYSVKIGLPVPGASHCPEYSDREVNGFRVLHTVYVSNKDSWAEWNMVRKPDDSRGQPHVQSKLYTELMTARAAPSPDQAQRAIDAMKAELSILHQLPEQTRSATDFKDGQDVYRWILYHAHQITPEQKRHLASILQAGIHSLEQFGFCESGSKWRDELPTLQQQSANERDKYKYTFGKYWMQAMDKWL